MYIYMDIIWHMILALPVCVCVFMLFHIVVISYAVVYVLVVYQFLVFTGVCVCCVCELCVCCVCVVCVLCVCCVVCVVCVLCAVYDWICVCVCVVLCVYCACVCEHDAFGTVFVHLSRLPALFCFPFLFFSIP